jgi:fumarate hydratase class I
MAKGGGSANKSYLFQETKALLNPSAPALLRSTRSCARSAPRRALRTTSRVVVGGTSAEYALKTAKLASARYLDTLPTRGGDQGNGFRDVELEGEVLELTQRLGIGAQFGGKYFCHDVRVIRLPRHGARCPVAIAVSAAADRQASARSRRTACSSSSSSATRRVPARGRREGRSAVRW